MDNRRMTYEQYISLYEALGGRTTHFMPAVGTKAWHKKKLSREDWERDTARLEEIESHDDDWLMQQHDYMDVFESECWESFDLRSSLFVIEWEKHQKVKEALG